MKLTDLKIRNFTVFEQADFSFVPGINVFIGENGTGKSHVLKMLYAVLKGGRDQSTDKSETERWQKERLAEIFKVGGGDVSAVGSLVRVGKDDEGATIAVAAEDPQAETRLEITASGELGLVDPKWPERADAIFLPARDVLATCEGFVALYDQYRIPFDETYRDVCQALEKPLLKGPRKEAADKLSESLRSMLRGEVTLETGRFHIDFGAGKHEAHLVAEGLRRIATVLRLIDNGSIQSGTVLLWDEPETNMNPRHIAALAGTLRTLAASGVQIFVATHDYLLSHRLSLFAEYDVGTNGGAKVEMKFFALHHARPIDPVEVESASTLAQIGNNSILDEYAKLYEDEQSLHQQELGLEQDVRSDMQ
jgi:predicted ATPase